MFYNIDANDDVDLECKDPKMFESKVELTSEQVSDKFCHLLMVSRENGKEYFDYYVKNYMTDVSCVSCNKPISEKQTICRCLLCPNVIHYGCDVSFSNYYYCALCKPD